MVDEKSPHFYKYTLMSSLSSYWQVEVELDKILWKVEFETFESKETK